MKELEHDEAADAVSVLDTVLTSHPFRRVLLPAINVLTRLIDAEKAKDTPNDERLTGLKDNLDYVTRQINKLQNDTAEKRARGMLRVLGFDEIGEAAPLSSLSGGLRMRVALAAAFFIDAQLLLLDEPTNHLDLPSVLWLENRLRGYKGSYLLVTHDRTLLENVVTSVMLLQDQTIEYFTCGFKDFEKRKVKLDKEREVKIERFLARNRNVDPSSPLARTAMKYKEWVDKRYQRQIMLQGKFTFKAPEPIALPEDITEPADLPLITVENVRFSYDVEKGLPFIFDNPINYTVTQGTRVGIIGPNGAGKSTLLKLMTNKLTPTEGSIKSHPDYKLAYFGQHSTKELKLEMTPLEFMCSVFPKERPGVLKEHLGKTSISTGIANTRISNLSFSQRSCVIFARLTFVPPHVLILDEPTNFLDLDSVDSLISACNKFKGALIAVTHNRDFLKRTSKHFLSIVPGAFLQFKTMRAAERATYSFITAMEEGKDIDVKRAIIENRGGGAVHTDEEQSKRSAALNAQQLKAKAEADAKKAEEDAEAARVALREEKRKARLAAQKTDWVAGDECYAHTGNNKYAKAVVIRNTKGMGVTIELATGKKMMVQPNKLKKDNPSGAEAAAPASSAGAKGKGRGGKGGNAKGGNAKSGGQGQKTGGQRGGRRGGRAPRGN